MLFLNNPALLDFLQFEFSLQQSEIHVALKQSDREQGPLPMILWKYGFISLHQLDRLHQWISANSS